MQIKNGVTVIATIKEIYEVIARELKVDNISEWVDRRLGRSKIVDHNLFYYCIQGQDTNINRFADVFSKEEIEVGRYWVFKEIGTIKERESWELRTYATFRAAQDYFSKQKRKGIESVWLFLHEELVNYNYELEYQPGVVDVFKTKEEVEERLLKHFSDTSPLIFGGEEIKFTMRVLKGGTELKYKYNKKENKIEWLDASI